MGIRITVSIVAFVFAGLGVTVGAIWTLTVSPHAWTTLVSSLSQPSAVGMTALLFAVIVIISAGVGVWATGPIRRRLLEIEEAAVILGAGHLHHRIDTADRQDEVGRLGQQFNQMGERFEQQVALLQRLNEENRKLAVESEGLIALQERQRLARDLHDSVSQQLFALTMLSSTALRLHTAGSAELGKTLQQMSDLSNAAQREMRALLLHLRPVELDNRTLMEAADQFLTAMRERYGMHCLLEVFVGEGQLSPAMEEGLFRILQEAAANVIKHADASSMTVRLAQVDDAIEMTILDDGIGIQSGTASRSSDSYGLKAMQERAMSLGGHCEVLPREHGTMVSVRVPSLKERNP